MSNNVFGYNLKTTGSYSDILILERMYCANQAQNTQLAHVLARTFYGRKRRVKSKHTYAEDKRNVTSIWVTSSVHGVDPGGHGHCSTVTL